MTREQSLLIVSEVVAGWPSHHTWTEQQLDSYANAISDLDYPLVQTAIRKAVRSFKFRPAVAELREFVNAQERIERPAKPDYAPGRATEPPAFVARWKRARGAGDYRPFPEQEEGMLSCGYKPPREPFSDRAVWVQADEYLAGPVPAIPGLP